MAAARERVVDCDEWKQRAIVTRCRGLEGFEWENRGRGAEMFCLWLVVFLMGLFADRRSQR